jgi:hypothetical protein
MVQIADTSDIVVPLGVSDAVGNIEFNAERPYKGQDVDEDHK